MSLFQRNYNLVNLFSRSSLSLYLYPEMLAQNGLLISPQIGMSHSVSWMQLHKIATGVLDRGLRGVPLIQIDVPTGRP